jgi:hypothetical protein
MVSITFRDFGAFEINGFNEKLPDKRAKSALRNPEKGSRRGRLQADRSCRMPNGYLGSAALPSRIKP